MCAAGTVAGNKFVARPEERLYSVMHALLYRCYKQPYSNEAVVGPLAFLSPLPFPTTPESKQMLVIRMCRED